MNHHVTIYSTTGCAACAATKEYLKEKGIQYEEHNVGEDDSARQQMLEKNGGKLTVPTVDIDGKIIVGYDKGKIDEALV